MLASSSDLAVKYGNLGRKEANKDNHLATPGKRHISALVCICIYIYIYICVCVCVCVSDDLPPRLLRLLSAVLKAASACLPLAGAAATGGALQRAGAGRGAPRPGGSRRGADGAGGSAGA